MYPLRAESTTPFHSMLPSRQPTLLRSFADHSPRRATQPDPNQTSAFDLKKLGATPTVRLVVYGALGVAAITETAFWCSWGWAKFVKKNDAAETA